ncbi:MAG TPA: metal-dependent hydrolase, partial [Myxococcaceae bacterium]|nr:metal-dependent hydrolase [Myxococcaceae bacterium]
VLMFLFSGLALIPDLDVVAFALRVPYGAPWGHRGASHSLAAALAVGLLAGWLARGTSLPPVRTGLWAVLAMASHGLLDILTDGGQGVALFWPLDPTRYFAPFRPLPVSPVGAGMFSARGLYVIGVELLAFAPLWLYALWPRRAVVAPTRLHLSG